MEDEKLIRAVRKRECLYNFDHPMFIDDKYKAKAWEEIGKQLNQSGVLCKLRWQYIRDSVCKGGGRSCKFGKTTLKFLLPYLETGEYMSLGSSLDYCKKASTSQGTTDAETTDTRCTDESSEDEEGEINGVIRSIQEANELIREVIKKDQTQTDDIELFCKCMALKVEQLDPKRQVIAKQKVLQIVRDLVMDLHEERELYQ